MGELVRLETVASLNTWPKTLPYVPALCKGTTKLGAVGGKLKAPDPESKSNPLQPQLPLSVETVSTSPTEAIGNLEQNTSFAVVNVQIKIRFCCQEEKLIGLR